MRRCLLGSLLIVVSLWHWAYGADVYAIRAGRVVDVVSGKVLNKQIIVIRGDRIESVASESAMNVPAAATVIDLSDRTVLPGLIDTHTHLTADPTLPPYHEFGLSIPRL